MFISMATFLMYNEDQLPVNESIYPVVYWVLSRPIQSPRFTLNTLQIPFIPPPKFLHKEFYLAITGREDAYTPREIIWHIQQRKILSFFLLWNQRMHPTQSPDSRFFQLCLVWKKKKNIAARDSHFWLDSTNTIPLSGNPQENSQPANANFVLLPSIIPLKEGFKQGHSSNSVHSVFSAGFQRSFHRGRETGHASVRHLVLPAKIHQILFPTVN